MKPKSYTMLVFQLCVYTARRLFSDCVKKLLKQTISFSLLSYLHVFHESKYPMDVQHEEGRVLDKVSDMGQCPTRGGFLW